MSKKDTFHDAVKNALIKEGWTITDDPLTFKIDEVSISIDLGAERVLAAEKDNRKIAVEIKSFICESQITDYHLALGQFLNYHLFLQESEPERELFLAVPQDAYNSFFKKEIIRKSAVIHSLKLIVYEPLEEVILEWTS